MGKREAEESESDLRLTVAALSEEEPWGKIIEIGLECATPPKCFVN